MPDLTHKLLPHLFAHRLPGLDLGEGFLYPNYEGGSILNIPSTICHGFGIPPLGADPLGPEILDYIDTGSSAAPPDRRIVMVLVDAMGLESFRSWISNGKNMVWRRMVDEGLLAPLTSTTPSTTSAALTSLWTGRSPAEHSIVGYELWMKEYGLVANMILHKPMSFFSPGSNPGSLALAGFKPESFLPWPTLGAHLGNHGVKAHAFQHVSIIDSGLSRMFFQGINLKPYSTSTDLWFNMRDLLESQSGGPLFAWVYWSHIDTFSHIYGPNDERTRAEFESFTTALERFFLHRLSHKARQNTLLLLIADHGQVSTPVNPIYDLKNHPDLIRKLHMFPTGENRLFYLFVRSGQKEAVREYLELVWPGQFSLLEPAIAVEAGLFGPGERHPYLLDRLGDLIVIGRGDAYLWWSGKDNHLLGRHGGLHPDEMLTPFLAAYLT
jgi:hypothetical protein